MKIDMIHDFDKSDENSLNKIQTKLKSNIVHEYFNKDIKYIAGVDLAYFNIGKKELAVCVICIVDALTLDVVNYYHEYGEINFPYVSGYLAFREIPLFLKVWEKVDINVDLVMFDGHGILHPKQMGMATHASFFIHKPTIGVGKTFFKFDRIEMSMPENKEGEFCCIKKNNNILGVALRTRLDTKPIFVSVGNYINLEQSIDIVMNMITKESRIPITTRFADIETHRLRKIYIEKNKE